MPKTAAYGHFGREEPGNSAGKSPTKFALLRDAAGLKGEAKKPVAETA